MKKYITAITVGALAGIGAAKVIQWACAGLAFGLTCLGGWQAADAAKAAPVILFALASGLALSFWGLHEDNERYSRSGYGKVEGFSARHSEPDARAAATRYADQMAHTCDHADVRDAVGELVYRVTDPHGKLAKGARG